MTALGNDNITISGRNGVGYWYVDDISLVDYGTSRVANTSALCKNLFKIQSNLNVKISIPNIECTSVSESSTNVDTTTLYSSTEAQTTTLATSSKFSTSTPTTLMTSSQDQTSTRVDTIDPKTIITYLDQNNGSLSVNTVKVTLPKFNFVKPDNYLFRFINKSCHLTEY